MNYATIRPSLSAGRTIVIDGGTGTDLQRRGVPMSGATWCAEANRTHPEAVRKVHAAYVHAGAEVVIANTFATSPLLFDALGRIDEMVPYDAVAVRIARRAAAGRAVVAGSFSTMRLVPEGSDRTRLDIGWTEAQARTLFARKAQGLAASGVDLIVMEMMRDTDLSVWATEAALATGLPVWVGISAERDHAGKLVGYGRPDMPLTKVAGALAGLQPDALAVMHTSVNDTGEALAQVRRRWSGPLGAYPESGYFTMPDWQFVGIIDPIDLADHAEIWSHEYDVRIIGGCCGTNPDHVRALHGRR